MKSKLLAALYPISMLSYSTQASDVIDAVRVVYRDLLADNQPDAAPLRAEAVRDQVAEAVAVLNGTHPQGEIADPSACARDILTAALIAYEAKTS